MASLIMKVVIVPGSKSWEFRRRPHGFEYQIHVLSSSNQEVEVHGRNLKDPSPFFPYLVESHRGLGSQEGLAECLEQEGRAEEDPGHALRLAATSPGPFHSLGKL